MLKPELQSFTVAQESCGEEADDFLIQIELDIGAESMQGSETFVIDVISPTRLEKTLELNETEFGRGMLITRNYDVSRVRSSIQKRLQTCSGETWAEIASNLSKYFRWEYD
ncbi:Imm8 family immunity protein [Saccharibacillus sacchari]|uniref:Imm8 family immunity protein n=1 Tax=Saccharibacillus sacchari TaxID=456493 RepID=UPI0004B24CDD|nr:Imm8 family immunity protein [Saccharibacillus sacchari]